MGRFNTINDYWNKVNKETSNSCWEWTGKLSKDGYGGFKMKHEWMQVHRWSMKLAGHDIAGKVVCHKCDNPKCVREDHLFLGTQADNVKDMIAKGRYVKPQSKLSDADIADIRNSKLSLKKIGTKYNISTCYASNIRNYKVGR
jgi:hypothetical protein